LVFFAHEFLTPFNDLLGQLVMAGIRGLLGAAGWWMHILTRTRRPARLLGAPLAPRWGQLKPERKAAVVAPAGEVMSG
jgi:tight adherence protein B